MRASENFVNTQKPPSHRPTNQQYAKYIIKLSIYNKMSKISKTEKSQTKDSFHRLSLSTRCEAFRPDWDMLRSNVLTGDALCASKTLLNGLSDPWVVTEFLVDLVRAFVFDGRDCHPARFLRLAAGRSERWAEGEQRVLGEVLSLVWAEAKAAPEESGATAEARVVGFIKDCVNVFFALWLI